MLPPSLFGTALSNDSQPSSWAPACSDGETRGAFIVAWTRERRSRNRRGRRSLLPHSAPRRPPTARCHAMSTRRGDPHGGRLGAWKGQLRCYGERTVKAAVAVPDRPVLVTVAVPGNAPDGTFVMRLVCPLESAVDEPRLVSFVEPALANVLATLSPTRKNSPEILNGAVGYPTLGERVISGVS